MGTTDWLKWVRVMFEGAIYSYCRTQYLVVFEGALSFQKGFSLAKQLFIDVIHFQKNLHMKWSHDLKILMFHPHTLHSDFSNHSIYVAFFLNHLWPPQPDEPAQNRSFVRQKF